MADEEWGLLASSIGGWQGEGGLVHFLPVDRNTVTRVWADGAGPPVGSEAGGPQGGPTDLARVVAHGVPDELDRCAGTLYVAIRARRCSRKASVTADTASASSGSHAGRSTMACTRWPRSSSGRPITAHDRTPGCWSIAASTSAGNTLAPPLTTRSVRRSTR